MCALHGQIAEDLVGVVGFAKEAPVDPVAQGASQSGG
jgi:hypothetical protein